MTREAELVTHVRERVAAVLASEPALRSEWREAGGRIEVQFHKLDENGFDVFLEANGSDFVVATDVLAHVHFDDDEDALASLEQALGLVRDLLSPHMRIRVFLAGRTPYRADIESFDGSKWQCERTTGLLLFNYFSRRSERILMNRHLPPRMSQSHSGGPQDV